MFQKISPTHVKSDSGFSLQSGPMNYWIYSEGTRKIHITSEGVHLGRDGWGECVYLGSLPDCWLPPDNIHAISAMKREEIALNIQAAFHFLDIKFRVA